MGETNLELQVEMQGEMNLEKIKKALKELIDHEISSQDIPGYDSGTATSLNQGLAGRLSEATGLEVTYASAVNDNGTEKIMIKYKDGSDLGGEFDIDVKDLGVDVE